MSKSEVVNVAVGHTETLKTLVEGVSDGRNPAVPVEARIPQIYLWGVSTHLGGKVVCACLRLDLNPEAPYAILIGDAPNVIRYAEEFCLQGYPVPVFIKEKKKKWKYIGNFRVTDWTDDLDEISDYAERAGRTHIVKVLMLSEEDA